MYNCIFLDLDGTVLDFSKSEHYAFFCTMRENGIPVTQSDFTRYHAINARLWGALERGEITKAALRTKRFELLLGQRGTWDWGAIDARYVSFLAQMGVPFAGAKELLYALHTRYQICVLTNGVRHSQEQRLADSGLAPYIDLMITSEEAGSPKPLPAMFRLAMERLGNTDMHTYVMLGDSLTADIAGAANVGVDAIWYAPNGGEASPENMPRYTARSYAEIAQILLENRD